MDLSITFSASPYENPVKRTISIPPSLSKDEIETFIKQTFDLQNERIELTDSVGKIYYIGPSLQTGEYILKTKETSKTSKTKSQTPTPAKSSTNVVPKTTTTLIEKKPKPTEKTAMIPPTQKKNPKTPSQPKLVPLEEEDIRIIDQSHMTHLPTTNNFSAADTNSGADPSWNCFGINPRKPQTWPMGSLSCAWFCGTFWSITALMQFSLLCISPCILSFALCNGNRIALSVGMPLMAIIFTLTIFPFAFVTVVLMVTIGLVLDILQAITWILTFGYCFQGCYGLDFFMKAENSTAKQATAWEPVTCPIGFQIKQLKSKVGISW